MFYISSLEDKRETEYGDIYRKVGITDTRDGVEEIFSNNDVVDLVDIKKLNVYGVYTYGRDKYSLHAYCTKLKYPQTLDYSNLIRLLDKHNKQHNPWSAYPIDDYLATAKIGTVITVHYSYTGDGDRRHHSSTTKLKKIDVDLWEYTDTNNTFSGMKYDSRHATHFLDVACCGSLNYSLRLE